MKRAWLALAAIIAAVAIVAAICWYLPYGDRSRPQAVKRVVIPRGESFGAIAHQLADDGIITSAFAFRLLARFHHDERDVHAGAYQFTPHQSAYEVLQALLTGGAQVAAWVTIPEGFTATQIAARLQQAGIGQTSSFERYFMESPVVIGSMRTKNAEGYLFPSTYLVPLGASPSQVQKQMTDQFFKELPSDAASRARALGITVTQGVTVASLVEREAKVNGDRPMIAGVIFNRLHTHMPLQVDATIEYALPTHKAELSYADLKIDSPYNTYVHDGLPPTPIANPGRPSLEAAFHPARTAMLYYVYCGNGHHIFARTLSEHQANVARCIH